MARRDTAAMAAQSFPPDNRQHRRGRRWSELPPWPESRTRSPARGSSAIGTVVREDTNDTTIETAREAAEALFGRVA